MKRPWKVVAVTLFLPVLIVGARLTACSFREKRLQAGYDAIQIGDSRSRVIDMMGAGESHVCPATDPQEEECREEIEYYSFLKRWKVTVDSNDGVSFKVHHEGLY